MGPSYSCDEVQASLVLETREMMRILKIVTLGEHLLVGIPLPSSRGNVSCVYMKIGMLKLLSLVHPYGKPSGGPSTRTRTRLRNFRADLGEDLEEEGGNPLPPAIYQRPTASGASVRASSPGEHGPFHIPVNLADPKPVVLISEVVSSVRFFDPKCCGCFPCRPLIFGW